MAVGIQGNGDARMAQTLAYNLRMHARSQQQRRRGVPQVMKTHSPDARFPKQSLEGPIDGISGERGPVRSGKDGVVVHVARPQRQTSTSTAEGVVPGRPDTLKWSLRLHQSSLLAGNRWRHTGQHEAYLRLDGLARDDEEEPDVETGSATYRRQEALLDEKGIPVTLAQEGWASSLRLWSPLRSSTHRRAS